MTFCAIRQDDVFGLEPGIDVHAELALGQIADVSHRRDDLEVAPQVFVDRLRLGRRLDDHQSLRHEFDASPSVYLLLVAGQSSLTKPPPATRAIVACQFEPTQFRQHPAPSARCATASSSRLTGSPARMIAH